MIIFPINHIFQINESYQKYRASRGLPPALSNFYKEETLVSTLVGARG
jgi:hypothetical protein